MGRIQGSQTRIRSCEYDAPALGVNNAVLADTAMDQIDPTEVDEFAGQPDVARNLTVKGNDANCSGDVVIEGLNDQGSAISETFALAGAAVVTGNKAFAEVTLITLPPYDTANTERVRVGLGAKLGLPVVLSRNTVIAAFLGGARQGTAPTVAIDPDELEKNTVTLDSALNGSDVIVDLYETN